MASQHRVAFYLAAQHPIDWHDISTHIASHVPHLISPHPTASHRTIAPHRTASHCIFFQAIRAIDTALKLLPENVSESTGIKRHRDNYQIRVDKLT